MPPSTTVEGFNLYQLRNVTEYESHSSLPFNLSVHEGNVIPLTPIRWHPKLTPYRGLTLLSGTGLCILKAVFAYKNVQVASIAVEWFLGTILIVILYTLDVLERHLKEIDIRPWFFNYDCMTILWSLFNLLHITPPEYSTQEDPDSNGRIRPLTTNYRLLVSASVVIFGFIKAALAYRELSNGAATVDWIFGAVVTTIIFFIGLYENNPNQKDHLLFDRDDSSTAVFIGREGFLIAGSFLIICIPVYALSLGRNVLRYFIDAFNEPFSADTVTDWILSAAGHTLYILMIDMILFVQYISLLIPIASILILRRYFQPTSMLGQYFTSLFRRNDNLQHLVPTTQTLELVNACVSQVISTGIAINSVLVLIFASVAALVWFFGLLAMAIFLLVPVRAESAVGVIFLAGSAQCGYINFVLLRWLREKILAVFGVGVGNPQAG